MRLDAHQHFWDFDANASDFVWMSDKYRVLRRNFLPTDFSTLLDEAGYSGSIAVQARELPHETDFLLELAQQYAFIKGVVGWTDLCSTSVESALESYGEQPVLKGFRMLIHDRTDPDFADSPSHARGVGLLAQYGWTYDLLLRTIHLPAAIRLVDRFPAQRFVVDHIAKPVFDGSDWSAWHSGIRMIAERPNVFCKLSGLVTETDWACWQSVEYARYLDEVVEAFGASRCMIGSDWPVCTCAADYSEAMAVVEYWAKTFSESEQRALLGDTCAHFYNVT